jgi:hypothetical protein
VRLVGEGGKNRFDWLRSGKVGGICKYGDETSDSGVTGDS